jgi:hypothetical protein
MQLSLHDGRMGDNRAVELEDEVRAAQRMVPVVLGPPVLADWERRPQDVPDRRDFLRRQVRGRDAAENGGYCAAEASDWR